MGLSPFKHRTIREAFFLYWLLLVYIIAALIWWFISLEKQSKERTAFELQLLKLDKLQPSGTPYYIASEKNILSAQKRRTAKNLGEGLTFLIVILVGAILVYRAVQKQFRLNQQQRNFIMAVTHELKTPIAISKLNVETLLKRKLSEEQQSKLLQNTLLEMHRLNDLVTNILIVSQVESGAYKMNVENSSITELITNTLSEIKNQHTERVMHAFIAENVYFKVDLLLFKLAFINLVDNALKYSSKEEPITITLTPKELIVADNGPGIAKEDKTRVFQKFYRVGNEVTRTTKGTGLGLYLCKKILSDHNFCITINDNKPKGSIFTVHF